jgi:hypothetical protein
MEDSANPPQAFPDVGSNDQLSLVFRISGTTAGRSACPNGLRCRGWFGIGRTVPLTVQARLLCLP